MADAETVAVVEGPKGSAKIIEIWDIETYVKSVFSTDDDFDVLAEEVMVNTREDGVS